MHVQQHTLHDTGHSGRGTLGTPDYHLAADRRLQGEGLKLDYLQVFELSTEVVGGQLVQVIQHRQEEPLYRRTHRFAPIEVPQETTIWAIDDGDHSTMLLPSEY